VSAYSPRHCVSGVAESRERVTTSKANPTTISAPRSGSQPCIARSFMKPS
jgi:hypothetical protein